jgi:hypothetical protein
MKETNILKTPEGRMVTLADGAEYKLSPLDLNSLALLEETSGTGLTELLGKFEERPASNMRLLLWVLLHSTYPELTIDDVGALVVADIMDSVMTELMKIVVEG